MTVSVEKIALGSCDVTFNAADLGATKGGVSVEIKTEKFTVKADQTGESPLKDIIIGTTVTIKVPLVETDLTRLQTMMPQSITQAAGGTPAGYLINFIAGYARGVTSIVVDTGTGAIGVGDKIVFASTHTTKYRVTSISGTLPAYTIGITQEGKAGTGLVAPIADNDALTVTKKDAGVEIRSGVNIDLFSYAFPLLLHPTGGATTEFDFYAFKAAPSADFSFKYNTNEERVYEVTFTCYPDTANNNRIAAFGDHA